MQLLLPRTVVGLLLVSALLTAGCSSPTSPTPAAARPPATNTTPPETVPPTPQSPPPPLTLTCPPAVTITAPGNAPAPVSYATPAGSGGVAPTQVSCTPPSGSAFPIGTNAVRCTATDSAEQTAACSFTVTVNPPLPRLSRTTFLAFGDSITIGEVSVASSTLRDGSPFITFAVIPAASYPTQLLTRLRTRYTQQAASLSITNAGVPGEWAEDGARRLPNLMANLRPEVLLLLHGINELAVFGSAGLSRAELALNNMAKEGRNRGARVFIATQPPPRPGGPKTISASLIASYNARIRTTALGEGAVLVDIFDALVTDVTRYIGADGLHPTEAGYQRIAEVFFDAIRADLEVR